MNRFERRLKTTGSPRPGTASCKITKKNVKVQSNNIVVNEINNQKKITNELIIDDVQRQNEKIAEKLKKCKNPGERIMLNHEMRINTIELNIDCLNNLEENNNNHSENMEILKNNMDYLLEENNKLKEEIQNITKRMNLMVTINSSKIDNKEKVVLDVKEVIDKKKGKAKKETANIAEEKPTFA